MFVFKTELLFAHWAVRALGDMRGLKWKRLVQAVERQPETESDALAFHLMMVRLNGCLTCDARKYAERGGCARCSRTTLTFSKETEEGLLSRFQAARKEIVRALREDKRLYPKAA